MAKKQPKSKEIPSTPEGVLVRLKNKICISAGIDPYKLKSMIDHFILTEFKGQMGAKAHFMKTNIYSELNKDRMTIKVFFKFLRVIKIKNIKISITITTVRDTQITVSEDIDILNVLDDDVN